MSDMHNVIIERLKAAGARFVIHEHVEARTVAESLERLPFPLEMYLTTVAFRLKQGGWALVGRRGTDRIDYKKVAAALGVKREQISIPAPEEVLAALGIETGTVSPIPTIEGMTVVMDSQLPRGVPLYAGAGKAGRTLEITLDDVLRVTGGRVADVVKAEAENG